MMLPQPHSERGPNSGTFVYMARSGEYRRQLVTARAACDVRMQRLTVEKWNVWKEIAAIGHTHSRRKIQSTIINYIFPA